MRRLGFTLVLAVVLAGVLPATADHMEHMVCPAEPSREFPQGFRAPIDLQALICANTANPWADLRVGGWGGGECPADHVRRTPVVFVHGQSTDGWYWNIASDSVDGSNVNVRQRFLDAGYCARELWAITYSGEATPRGGVGSSYNTYADIQAEEAYQFIRAVRDFVGTTKVDVIGHSLGVTVVRKAMFLHRDDPAATNPYIFVRHALMIAGANHGTTTCRGEETVAAVHVCEEVAPGSAWLDELNSIGESRGPTTWATVCDCGGVADDFYLGPDALSPLLDGAKEIRLPNTDHFQLAASETAIAAWRPFLIEGSAAAAAPVPKPGGAPATAGKPVAAPGPRTPSVVSLPATGVASSYGLAVVLLSLALLGGFLRKCWGAR